MTQTIQLTHDDYLSVCDFYDDTSIIAALIKRNPDSAYSAISPYCANEEVARWIKTWLHFPNIQWMFYELHPYHKIIIFWPPAWWYWIGFTEKFSLKDMDKIKKMALEIKTYSLLTPNEYNSLKVPDASINIKVFDY